MAPTQGTFVRAIREQLGLIPTDFGEQLGQKNAYNRVHDWETERTRLKFDEMLAMLQLAGWLTPEAQKRLEEAERDALRRVGQSQRAATQAASKAQRLPRPPRGGQGKGAST